MEQMTPYMKTLMWLDSVPNVILLSVILIGIRLLWVYKLRPKVNEIDTSKKKRKDYFLEVLDLLIIAAVLVFGIIRPFFLNTFFIPTESMVPTILVQDKIIANRFIHHFRPFTHGEMVIFESTILSANGTNFNSMVRYYITDEKVLLSSTVQTPYVKNRDELLEKLPPLLPKLNYVKRVIGVPGDRIKIIEGEGVYRNGELLDEPYITKEVSKNSPEILTPSEPGAPPQLADFLKGATTEEELKSASNLFYMDYHVWIAAWFNYNELYLKNIKPYMNADGEFVVPEKSLFVLGDNRTNSFDSHYWGVVSEDDVRGRPVCIFWPLHRMRVFGIK